MDHHYDRKISDDEFMQTAASTRDTLTPSAAGILAWPSRSALLRSS